MHAGRVGDRDGGEQPSGGTAEVAPDGGQGDVDDRGIESGDPEPSTLTASTQRPDAEE
jgi:hypothetical protein